MEMRLVDDYDSLDYVNFDAEVATRSIKRKPPRSRQEQVTIRRKVEDVLSDQQMKKMFQDPWCEL